ncbi:Hypothetical predicted protein [Lecanosticta acicola]|uniref:Uncharacterized protein n=1 Tax=Lecanosticta acicola TaxID=111012 RepID=A0AAI9E828_9PEZI|nr:Hypothetical predicted protein [Lecanosticta acicola]
MARHGHRRESRKNPLVKLSGDLAKINAAKVERVVGRAVNNEISLTDGLKVDIVDLHSEMVKGMQGTSAGPKSSMVADYEAGNSNATFVDLQPFFKYVNKVRPQLDASINEMSGRVLAGLDVVRGKATFAEEDGYIVTAMEPVHDKVRALKATKGAKKPPNGWPQYREEIFKQELTQINGIWAAVYKGIETDLIQLLTQERQTLAENVGHVFNEIHEGFNLMCPATEAVDPVEEALQDTLKVHLRKAEEYLEGPMRQALDKLMVDFR